MADLRIAVAGPDDGPAWLDLRDALWPGLRDAHRQEIEAWLADRQGAAMPAALPPGTVRQDGAAGTITLLAFAGDAAVGLAEAAIRHDYVNGCDTTPVLFLEGLFVAAAARRRGIARALVDRVADWGAALGCVEFASDAEIGNRASHLMHAALGFEETERVVFFRRAIMA